MKKTTLICITVLLLLISIPVSATDITENSVGTISCKTLDALTPFVGTQQLVSNTGSAILYETNTDTLMYAYNADAPMSPASLVKILTALIAIEKGSMDDVVTVQGDTLATLAIDALVVDLVNDEVLTVKDLLNCMMVGSGNDAAIVLAVHVLGSQQAFVDEMNRYAQELGCTSTNFTNVHGLHDDAQYTTARDMAKIFVKAIQNPELCELMGIKTITVPKTNKSDERHLVSQNALLNDNNITYYDARVVGGRTGVANDRTRSVATVAEVDSMQLICIVMGSKSQYEKDGYTEKVSGGYNETKQLLDIGFSGYKTAQILYPGQAIQQKPVTNGSCEVVVGTSDSIFAVLPENVRVQDLVYKYTNEINMTAPLEKGQRLSTLEIWYGSSCIAQTEVYAMNRVAVAGTEFAEKEKDNGVREFLTIVLYLLGGILGIAVLVFVGLFAVRSVRVMNVKRQSRRNSRNRRRSR